MCNFYHIHTYVTALYHMSVCLCVTGSAKSSHVCMQTEFISLFQLIATLNNYACSLPLLAHVNWSAFPECILLTMKINDWWIVPIVDFKLAVETWYILSPLLVNVCLSLVIDYWPIVDTCRHHSHSKLYHLHGLTSLF